MYGIITLCDGFFQSIPFHLLLLCRSPTTPNMPKQSGFGLFPGRSPLPGESLICFLLLQVIRCFSSLRLLTLRYGTPSVYRVAPFGNLCLKGYLHLNTDYRSLSRPSSPVRA